MRLALMETLVAEMFEQSWDLWQLSLMERWWVIKRWKHIRTVAQNMGDGTNRGQKRPLEDQTAERESDRKNEKVRKR